LNGLGCRSQEPPTDIELRFIKKQKRFGRTPKACADFSHCVECSKSCVVETLESVWLLLSFRHAIEYGKPLYIGSVNAVERYETLLLKIDLRLGLVDEATLKKRALNFSEKVWLRYGRFEEKEVSRSRMAEFPGESCIWQLTATHMKSSVQTCR
jgi:hypothetical protein